MLLETLRDRGFSWSGTRLLPPAPSTKEEIRALHSAATAQSRLEAARNLAAHEPRLLRRIANGIEVRPEHFRPRLVQVARRSEEELLFRYARLHWSIPTSRGYGRRLRFVVIDQANDKLVGVIGLADPVFAMRDRDNWIGWTDEDRRLRLSRVMDAFVLGAVPPYSFLLAGKLMALLVASNEVRRSLEEKYLGATALISGRSTGGPVLVTTVSALGRSSIYNRLTLEGERVFISVGATQGTGELFFSDAAYDRIRRYAGRWCTPTARHERWGGGTGFRNRREVIKKCLADVGLSPDWNVHGIRREVFAVPLARNARSVLKGVDPRPDFFDRPADDLAEWFKQRWMLPRAHRDQGYRAFHRDSYELWGNHDRPVLLGSDWRGTAIASETPAA